MHFEQLLERVAGHRDSLISVRPLMAEPTTKSFPEVASDVRKLRDVLAKLGLRSRQLVGLHALQSYEFLVWDLALLELGAIPQVFPEDTTLSDLQAKAAGADFACVISKHCRNLVLPRDDDAGAFASIVAVNPRASTLTDTDLLTRVYSSGTTGQLKGLEISRRGAESLASQFIDAFGITSVDRHLIFLPLSHFQQRLSIYACLWSGASIALTPFTHVFHDLPLFEPTFLIGPPVFYESLLVVYSGGQSEQTARDNLVAGLGKRIRFMITGMAPVRRAVLDAFARCDLRLLEAYGMTEVGLIAWNVPGQNRIGTVGRPLGSNRIELSEDSEILVRSTAPLTRRYFDASEEDSQATFRGDGLIATGDFGSFADGYLVLTGRKKDVIVTSSGQKFQPLEVERLLLECLDVKQAAVVCAGERQDVVAVLSVGDTEDSATLLALKKHVATVNRALDMHRNIARVILTTVRFSAENGLLTRNLKLNRRAIAGRFAVGELGADTRSGLALESI